MSTDNAGAFPDLSGMERTRDTLHAYSRVLGAVRRTHAPADPRWWHTSLRVGPRGLVMPTTPWPDRTDAGFAMTIDLVDHRLTVEAAGETVATLDLREGLSASALGDRVVHSLNSAGVHVAPERERYADETNGNYDPDHAGAWLAALHGAQRALGTVREDLEGERSPIQLWPHHFDLSFECFGSRVVTFVEEGEEREATSQIGCGFSSIPTSVGGAEPYFYATPWPFDDAISQQTLPCEAAWVTEGWQGALLPYAEVRARGERAVEEFCVAVFELARSSLT